MTVAAALGSPRVNVFSCVSDVSAGDGACIVNLIAPAGGLLTLAFIDYFFANKNYLSAIDWQLGTAGLVVSSASGLSAPIVGTFRSLLSLSGVAPANYPAGTIFSVVGTL